MSSEILLNLGTELILETAAGSGALTDTSEYYECTDDTRTSSDNAGYTLGIFEFDTAASSPFTAAPTAGATIVLYEQKINSDTNDAFDVSSTHEQDYLYTFVVAPSDTVQRFVTTPLNINRSGGKYWVNWIDGGAGTADMDAGWELRLTPVAFGQA